MFFKIERYTKMMKGPPYLFFLFLLAILSPAVMGQVNPKEACRIEDGQLVFKLDLQWTPAQKQEVARLFNLDSIVMAGVYSGKLKVLSNGVEWQTRKLTPRIVELYKPLSDLNDGPAFTDDIVMVDDDWAGYTMEPARESVAWGVNKFTRYSVFQYIHGAARFYLPGHLNAKEVFLSGTFNRWSTTQMPMVRSDSGWTIKLRLKPGKYFYKYIIDGRWASDPFNRQFGNDGGIRDNSVVFCFNHKFVLKGNENAKDVYVTGSFNGWNQQELKMFKTNYGWVFPMYLREGTHAYKFLVDGVWMTDPDNKVVYPDGAGHFNSFIGIGDAMLFTLDGYSGAKKVMVSGSFNGWNQEELAMLKITGGWQLPYVLASGNYEYKFIVDGNWITDPANPYTVGSGATTNSFLAVRANHTFILDDKTGFKSVVVTGSFNGWNRNGYRMVLKDHQWIFPISLKPGKYTYKFIVNGKWILDPGNELWEENEYGDNNSVLWIDH